MYENERYRPNGLAKELTAENFKEMIIDDDSIDQFILEIFGTYCHACGFAGVLYSSLSHKLKKHGYAQSLPLFKANTENQIPYLGVFNYTPAYFYVRKDKKTGQITEIQTLDRIFGGQKFID